MSNKTKAKDLHVGQWITALTDVGHPRLISAISRTKDGRCTFYYEGGGAFINVHPDLLVTVHEPPK